MENICRICLKFTYSCNNLFDYGIPHKIETISSVSIRRKDQLPHNLCLFCEKKVYLLYDFRNEIIRNTSILLKQLKKKSNGNNFKPIVMINNDVKKDHISSVEFSDEGRQEDDNSMDVESAIHSNSSKDYTVSEQQHMIQNFHNIQSIDEKLSKKQVHKSDDLGSIINDSEINDLKDVQESEKFDLLVKTDDYKNSNVEFTNDLYYEDFQQSCHQIFNSNGLQNDIVDTNTRSCDTSKPLQETYENEQSSDINTVNSSEAKNLEQAVQSSNKIRMSLKTYECHYCVDFKTNLFTEFQKHKRTHPHAFQLTLCNICGKMITNDNFARHLLIHSSDNEVTCEICGKVFKNIGSMRGHVKAHTLNNFECGICNRKFSNVVCMRTHLRKHALGSNLPHKCSVCEKSFFASNCLKRHMRSHTGERPYPCQYCKKGFSTTNALKTHTRQHTNEKPYVCKYCGSGFHQKVSLKTHLKSKHSDKPQDI